MIRGAAGVDDEVPASVVTGRVKPLQKPNAQDGLQQPVGDSSVYSKLPRPLNELKMDLMLSVDDGSEWLVGLKGCWACASARQLQKRRTKKRAMVDGLAMLKRAQENTDCDF